MHLHCKPHALVASSLFCLACVQVYISTGAGALGHLPNSKIQAILARMRPTLRAAEYDEAVEQAVVDIGLGLAGAGTPLFIPISAADGTV